MVNLDNVEILNCIVHKIGSHSAEEPNQYAQHQKTLSDSESAYLQKILLKPFKSVIPVFEFITEGENTIATIVEKILSSEEDYVENTCAIAQHLFNQSVHNTTKPGYMFILYLGKVEIEKQLTDAVAIFKLEGHTTFLQQQINLNNTVLEFDQGLITKNIEKAALIVNYDSAKGLTIYSYEKNVGESNYWNKNFLNAVRKSNDFNNTFSLLDSYKDFVLNTETLADVSKKDKLDLVQNSVAYVMDNSEATLKIDDFILNNIANESAQEEYRNHLDLYSQSKNIELQPEFNANKAAIQYHQKKFRSIIKLDKNFHIYVHTNQELMETGVDENGKKYYKLFFENEA